MTTPDWEWVQSKLDVLMEHADELKEISPVTEEPDPEFGAWTALKLEVLVASVDVYTKIMSSHDYTYYFVDAMSGPGVVDINGRPESLIGSPIIAGTVAHEPFHRMYLIEKDRDRAEALRDRLDYASDQIPEFSQSRDSCVVINENANDVLPNLRDRIEDDHPTLLKGTGESGGQHHLAFIDNESHDIDFESIRQLESIPGDLLINYPNTVLNRRAGNIESQDDPDWDKFDAFFDDRIEARELNEDERFALYLELLETIKRGDTVNLPIRASREYPYYYRMIYATKNRKGGGGFLNFMESYSERMSSLTGDDVERIFKTMRGEFTNLDHWTEKDAETEENQADLGEFD